MTFERLLIQTNGAFQQGLSREGKGMSQVVTKGVSLSEIASFNTKNMNSQDSAAGTGQIPQSVIIFSTAIIPDSVTPGIP